MSRTINYTFGCTMRVWFTKSLKDNRYKATDKWTLNDCKMRKLEESEEIVVLPKDEYEGLVEAYKNLARAVSELGREYTNEKPIDIFIPDNLSTFWHAHIYTSFCKHLTERIRQGMVRDVITPYEKNWFKRVINAIRGK